MSKQRTIIIFNIGLIITIIGIFSLVALRQPLIMNIAFPIGMTFLGIGIYKMTSGENYE